MSITKTIAVALRINNIKTCVEAALREAERICGQRDYLVGDLETSPHNVVYGLSLFKIELKDLTGSSPCEEFGLPNEEVSSFFINGVQSAFLSLTAVSDGVERVIEDIASLSSDYDKSDIINREDPTFNTFFSHFTAMRVELLKALMALNAAEKILDINSSIKN